MFSYLLGKEYLAAYPTLKNLIEKVLEVPSIKPYIEKRPVTEFWRDIQKAEGGEGDNSPRSLNVKFIIKIDNNLTQKFSSF